MKILVTGGAGFIGSHVVDAYVAAGHEVVVLDDLSTGKVAHLNPCARFYKLDVAGGDVGRIFAGEKFEVVSHHAAQIDVRQSVADPAADARVNILGSLNLMEHAVRHRVRAFIFASSGGAIYGEPPDLPATEAERPMPLSPYGVAKLAAEQYLHVYAHLHGLRSISLRYGNVYGPRQDPLGEAGVVAIFCRRLLQGEPPIVYGDGSQTRDYVYVGDVTRANLLALRHLAGDIEALEAIPLSQQMAAGSMQQAACSRQEQSDSRPAELSNPPQADTAERSLLSLPAANCQLPANKNALNNSITQKLNNVLVLNIGTGIETSVLELVRALAPSFPASDGAHPQFAPPRPGEVSRMALDFTRARELLGWEPRVPLAEGLRLTAEWLRAEYGTSGGLAPIRNSDHLQSPAETPRERARARALNASRTTYRGHGDLPPRDRTPRGHADSADSGPGPLPSPGQSRYDFQWPRRSGAGLSPFFGSGLAATPRGSQEAWTSRGVPAPMPFRTGTGGDRP